MTEFDIDLATGSNFLNAAHHSLLQNHSLTTM